MGIFQKAIETYDCCKHLAGIQSSEYKEPLAPIGHITTSANLEISVYADGKFASATKVGKDEPKIVIPAYEDSAGRTSKAVPHPLCDNVGYVSPKDESKHLDYVTQLEAWCNSEHTHPKLKPILTYVKSGTILDDLSASGITPGDKDMIRWNVISANEAENGATWTDQSLFQAFTNYCISLKKNEKTILCMAEGIETAGASQHIKGVVSLNGNAKLISANDSAGFTYRGRFKTDDEALTVGFEASQKAHNALKWLVASQGQHIGGRTFLCWNPRGKTIARPMNSVLRKTEKPLTKPSDYKNELAKAVMSYKNNFAPDDSAVIALFDAATTGRLSVTYYSEMPAGDFMDKLAKWDSECCWSSDKFGISAPSLDTIVNCAFGREINGRIEADEQILKQHVQRLISCKMDGVSMPYDIVAAISKKTMTPLAYEKALGTLQFTACAVIRKYYLDKYKEEYQMALEKDKQDISYQYGRLLAVLEKAERDTYTDEGREPNAIRLQSAYCAHPAETAATIIKQLKNGYYQKLSVGAKIFYEALIGEIMEQISGFSDSEQRSQLKETFIMGYYLQKNDLYKKNTASDTNDNDNK